ncbi:MAG: hypothetical protein M1812_003275 [Candelaria pacifica]|nr:MAG: hypothetical protein M1812_003275 [Candelaria pacifica]
MSPMTASHQPHQLPVSQRTPYDKQTVKDTIDPAERVQSTESDQYNDGLRTHSKVSSQTHLPSTYSSMGHESERSSLGWRDRLKHFTWAFFTMTMATGGIANVISAVPYRFRGLYTIGCIFMILNIVLFMFNVLIISLRFYLYPYTFRSSFLHPTESLFVPTSLVSIGTILINITQYGLSNSGYWLNVASLVLFWIYAALAFLLSFGAYLIMWSTQTFTIDSMTPAWIFPAYPLLVVGPYAGSLSSYLSPSHSLTLITGGITLQLLGFIVAFLMYGAYIERLMTQGLPQDTSRPSMFVSVGPAGFTATALINIAKNTPRAYGENFMENGVWAFVFVMMIRAVVVGEILMPQKGEDRDEGGWKEENVREHMGSRTRGQARERKREKAESKKKGREGRDEENGRT